MRSLRGPSASMRASFGEKNTAPVPGEISVVLQPKKRECRPEDVPSPSSVPSSR